MSDKDTLYSRWLSGELTPEEESELRHSGGLEELEKIVSTVDQWKTPDYDLDKAFKALKERRAHSSISTSLKEGKEVRLFSKRFMRIAAAVLLLAVVWVVFTLNRSTTIVALKGQIAQVELPDGTKVQLNDGSSITYKRSGLQRNRKVRLKGEAYFDVTSGNQFVVETDNGSVAVLGTQFNVNAWVSDLKVTCYEGSVAVRKLTEETILTAGQAIFYIDQTSTGLIAMPDNQPEWMSGYSRFSDEPLSKVWKEIERQFDVTVAYPDSQQKYSGIFEHQDLESAVRNVCLPMGLDFEIDSDQSKVLITTRE